WTRIPCGTSSSRSTPPSRWAREPDSGCRSPTTSSSATAAPFPCRANLAPVPPSPSPCRWRAAGIPMQPDAMQADVVEYRLSYEGDARERIVLETCADDHSLDVPDDFEAPDWARLAHHQCSNCPLDPAQHVWCPV